MRVEFLPWVCASQLRGVCLTAQPFGVSCSREHLHPELLLCGLSGAVVLGTEGGLCEKMVDGKIQG